MTPVFVIDNGDMGYPKTAMGVLGQGAPASISAIGNLDMLAQPLLGFFCSSKCPGSIILQTYDTVCALREAGVAVIGGFHSPMEQECLRLLLRGRQPIVICPARSITRMRVAGEWREPLSQGRLLILSPFEEKVRRPTRELAHERNRFVAALAAQALIAHCDPGGSIEELLKDLTAWGKPVVPLAEAAEMAHRLLGPASTTPDAPTEPLP